MARLSNFLGVKNRDEVENVIETDQRLEKKLLQEEQQENLQLDKSVLDDEDGTTEQRLAKVAEKEVQSAAEDSLKKLHVIKMGRCPLCGEHLHQHLFASICEGCGWHTFDVPPNGPVRIHLKNGKELDGDRCYIVKTGAALVLKDDLVVAKVPRDSYDYVEYIWNDGDIDQRHRQVVDRMQLSCGWCNSPASPEMEGFHLVHVAFGATQERYCFCSDECFEAFRKMYPARVHRDCYERNCDDCNLCMKRYGREAEGLRTLAKDFLTLDKKKKQK